VGIFPLLFFVERVARDRSAAKSRVGALRDPPPGAAHHVCRRFETGGSLGRRVSVAACPSPDGSSARASAKGESEAAGDRRERGGNHAAFVFVPRPGRVRLQ
jgi:hypothetical protein